MAVLIIFPVILQTVINLNAVYWRTGHESYEAITCSSTELLKTKNQQQKQKLTA